MCVRAQGRNENMNTASDWLFNLMLWGAVVTLLVLLVNLATPILGATVALLGLVLVVVLSALWPKW
jgi:hypothetical protein